MIEIENLVHDFCKDNNLCINFSTDMPKGYETAYGTFDITKNTLFFNIHMLKETPDYEILFYLFHELRHAMQYKHPEQFDSLLQRSLSYAIMYDGTCYKLINGNWREYKLEGSENYLTDIYLGQPNELDANRFAFGRVQQMTDKDNVEKLEQLYSFWTPKIKLQATEYIKIYEEIDKALS